MERTIGQALAEIIYWYAEGGRGPAPKEFREMTMPQRLKLLGCLEKIIEAEGRTGAIAMGQRLEAVS
jgi:hypothetical protein